MKPGNGWTHISGPVWENPCGARIHLAGLIRLPDKETFLSLNVYPECLEGLRLIRINGGNKKRGLMAWANKLTSRTG